ncbi:MAG: YegP family protein [Chlorobi bacterium]|nr:YegP family protein [Chlorobiota bacterium]
MKVLLKKSEAAEPFTFNFVDNGGKVIVKSENYAQKASAKNGIESVKKNSKFDERYELKSAKNGKFFFNLKATNGQIVATSMFFATESDRAKAIELLKAEAQDAPVEEV